MKHQAAAGSDNLAAARRRVLPAAVLLGVTLLAYLPAARAGFIWDDGSFLRDNPLIRAAGGLRLFWFSARPTDYFPLTSTMLWIEWRLWGDHPAGYHVVNVLLHAAAVVLLWRILRRLHVPGAWLAGALFAVHPVAAASVAWIAERKNTLSMMLYLLSLLAYLRYDEREELARRTPLSAAALGRESLGDGGSPQAGGEGGRRWYALAIFLFLLALLAKTSVVMLPAVLLLCAWWRRGRISRKDLLRSVPFFALSLALGLVTVWFQRHNAIHGEIVRPEGLASRLAAAGWIAWFYLFRLLLPAGLCVIYPRWNVDGSSALAFLPLLLLLGGMAFLWTRRKSWGRAPVFAAAYFLIMLLPVLGFLDMAFMWLSLVADHLQYAAMIGVIALAAGLLARAAHSRGLSAALGGVEWAAPGTWTRWSGALAATGCVAVLAFLTWGRASLYRDDGALLWRDNLDKNPANPAAWVAWHHLGDICARAHNYEGAIRSFDHVVALNPNYAEAYYNRADASFRLGQYNRALNDCDRAIALKRNFAAAYNGRARILYRMKQYGKALADMETYRKLGGRPDAAFLEALARAASRGE